MPSRPGETIRVAARIRANDVPPSRAATRASTSRYVTGELPATTGVGQRDRARTRRFLATGSVPEGRRSPRSAASGTWADYREQRVRDAADRLSVTVVYPRRNRAPPCWRCANARRPPSRGAWRLPLGVPGLRDDRRRRARSGTMPTHTRWGAVGDWRGRQLTPLDRFEHRPGLPIGLNVLRSRRPSRSVSRIGDRAAVPRM